MQIIKKSAILELTEKDFFMKITYDHVLDCYCLHYNGEIVALGAPSMEEAKNEAESLINSGFFQ